MMTARKNPTKRQAEKVLTAVKKAFAPWLDKDGNGPVLKENWDWFGHGNPTRWSIVWEEGPYQWTYLFPFGGRDEEFGFKIADVSDAIPAGFYAEAETGWAIGLYEA